jgi:stage IV sporulation protein FB
VTEVMRTEVPVMSVWELSEKAFDLLQGRRSPVVVVTGDDGRIAGLVTPENVGELLLVHGALRGRWPAPRGG